MPVFRLWAPEAGRVELDLTRQRCPMKNDGGGWWSMDVATVEAPADYGFMLDGEGPFPDPRSPWQPAGVHGPSRLVDHATYPWTDHGWQPPPFKTAVIYEIHVGTFTPEGTFEAAIGHLDHLVQVGITHVELMPVAEFPGVRGWGYDGVDLYAPHHAYGGHDGLKHLVNECHGRGLAVLLDVVYNHLGPAGNYLGRFGPYFTDRYNTPWGSAVNLDGPGSDEVRRFLCDNALMWLRDYHLDGLRLDAVHSIFDQSATHFLEQLVVEVRDLEGRLGRPLILVAESDLNDPKVVRSQATGGYSLDAQWNDDFHHALHAILTGECEGYYSDFGSLGQLAKALQCAYVYDGCYSRFRRRRHGRPATGLSGHSFLAYLQNHDQVGNRAKGKRSSHLMSVGRLKVGAAIVYMSPFIPMLFQGEEWGASTPFQYFTDHDDPDVAQAVIRGRREEFAGFGWRPEEIPNPQVDETFARSKLDWDELAREPHAGLLNWHRRLVELRRSLPELGDGCMNSVCVRHDEANRWLVVQRGRIYLACNLSDRPQAVSITQGGDCRVLLASDCDAHVDTGGVAVPPNAVVILASSGIATGS